MLLFTLGGTVEIVVTLNEKRTLSNGYYLFVFDHITTRTRVTKIFSFAEDESGYQERYNQFTVTTNSIFSGQPVGDWKYWVYEQASAVNTDPTGLTEVENGIMKLKPATEFSFVENTGATTFKEYAG